MAYIKADHYDSALTERLQANYLDILSGLGEDTTREGLLKTPERASKAIQFLTQGYAQDAAEILKSAMFREDYSEMVVVKDIELYSLCEHHILPFFGKAHVAYRCIFTPFTSTGATDTRHSRCDPRHTQTSWGSGCHRSPPHVHDDAGSTKTKLPHYDISFHRAIFEK